MWKITKAVFFLYVFLTVVSLSITGFSLPLHISHESSRILPYHSRGNENQWLYADRHHSCFRAQICDKNPLISLKSVGNTSWSSKTLSTGGYFLQIPNLSQNFNAPLKTEIFLNEVPSVCKVSFILHLSYFFSPFSPSIACHDYFLFYDYIFDCKKKKKNYPWFILFAQTSIFVSTI